MLSNLKITFSSMAAICLTGAALMLTPCSDAFAATVYSVTAPGDTSAFPADIASVEQFDGTLNAILIELLEAETITTADATVTAPDVIAMAETTANNADNPQCDLSARSMSCN